MFRNVPKFLDAVELGLIKDVKSYIGGKYDINITDQYGRSATIIAAGRNDLEMLETLVKANANLDVQDAFGNSPLKKAEKNNNAKMVNFIKEKISLNIKITAGRVTI